MGAARTSGQDRHFLRRRKAAEAGLHLPSEEELLHGMPFFKSKLQEDVREYAIRLARRARQRGQIYLVPVIERLDDLATDPDEEGILALEEALNELPDTKAVPVDACRLRCGIYRAFFGQPQAGFRLAGELASIALKDIQHGRQPQTMSRSLGWAVASTYAQNWKRLGVGVSRLRIGSEAASYEPLFESAIRRAADDELDEGSSDSPNSTEGDDDEGTADARSGAKDPAPADSLVVMTGLGNVSTSEGKRVASQFGSLLKRPLPLKKTPDLAPVRSALAEEFPYASDVVDRVLNTLAGQSHVWMRPTVYIGPPGCGKSLFVRRLAELLKMPYELIPCGGMSDSAIGGTPRRWSTGEPSLPIMAIHRHECAGPFLILDEFEKVATSRHNGNAHDVLLGLLEKETASRWHDPYIEAECNLGAVTWLMTANSIEPVPAPLRDRCRILRFPEPGVQHLAALAPRILQALYVDAGHDRRWATPLDNLEKEILASAWGGGSIRKLKRLLEGLMDARERERSRQ